MTMDTLVYTFQRGLSFIVRINGVQLLPANPLSDTGTPAVKSIRVNKSLDSPVPTVEVELSRLATWIQRGQTMTVDLGYNNITRRVFTGFVQDRSRRVAGCVVRGLGKSFTLYRTIQIDERDVSGDTVEEAIQDILDYVGIDDAIIEVDSYTLGTSGTEIKLSKMPASQMVQMLADIDGSRGWETNNGTLIIRRIEEVPAPTAYANYKTNDQDYAIILDGSDREDPDYFRDQVVVTGAILDADGEAAEDPLIATATLVNSGGLIQPPLPADSHIGMEYNNHLIDTQDELEALALILLSRYARIPRYLTVDIAGDPRLDIGMTIGLDFSEMGIGSSRWFVAGIQHTVDVSQGFRTQILLRGGDLIGGTLTINPVASFLFDIEQEVMGGRVLTIVGLNAESSYDPDGTIASYAWSSNQPGITFTSAARQSIVADTTGWVGEWTITLTVTDSDGATSTNTQIIPYANDSRIVIPAIFQAINNNASASPDGGVTNNNQSGSTCVSVDAKPSDGVNSGIACYGYTDGSIKRTTNFCASTLTTVLAAAGANGTINHIWWDKNVLNRVWACTSTGRLLVSVDDGVTWTVYKDFGGTYPLSRIATPPPSGVWVFGGRGDQTSTLIQYDAQVNQNWQSIGIGGQLAADLVGASSSVTVADAASREGGELAIIFKGAALPGGVSIFYCPGPPNTGTGIFGTGADWVRATGLTGGLSEGRFIIPDAVPGTFHAAFNNRSVWHTTDGVAYTETADLFPADTVPWHALWFGAFLGEFPGVHMAALQDTVTPNNGYIVKTSTGFQTQVSLRPVTGINTWPASAQGKMVALGAPRTSQNSGRVLICLDGPGGDYFNAQWLYGSATDWTQQNFNNSAPGLVGTAEVEMTIPFALTRDLWIAFGMNFESDNEQTIAYITRDGGLSWEYLPHPDGHLADSGVAGDCWQHFVVDAGGRIWGMTLESVTNANGTLKMWYSDNECATWTLAYTLVGTSGVGNIVRPIGLVAHPNNQNIIAALTIVSISIQDVRTIVTIDRGNTWTVNRDLNTEIGETVSALSNHHVMTDNGRIVYAGYIEGGTLGILTSDTYGVSWVDRTPASGDWLSVTASNQLSGIGRNRTGQRLFVVNVPTSPTRTGIPIWYSEDFGTTWNKMTNDAPDNEGTTTGIGVAYDEVENTLYLLCCDENTTSDPRIVRKLISWSPDAPASEWVDISGTIGAESIRNNRSNAIVVIPR